VVNEGALSIGTKTWMLLQKLVHLFTAAELCHTVEFRGSNPLVQNEADLVFRCVNLCDSLT
jgi:hypothetical protein